MENELGQLQLRLVTVILNYDAALFLQETKTARGNQFLIWAALAEVDIAASRAGQSWNSGECPFHFEKLVYPAKMVVVTNVGRCQLQK